MKLNQRSVDYVMDDNGLPYRIRAKWYLKETKACYLTNIPGKLFERKRPSSLLKRNTACHPQVNHSKKAVLHCLEQYMNDHF